MGKVQGMSEQLTYFAELNENNVVVHVSMVTAQFMEQNPERYPGVWVQTYYDRPDKTYAGVGYIYDSATNDFIRPPIEIFNT